jgi:hypothetical protein
MAQRLGSVMTLAALAACGGGEGDTSYVHEDPFYYYDPFPIFQERGKMFTVGGTSAGEVCIEDFYVDVKSDTASRISDAIFRYYGPYPAPAHTVWSSDEAGCSAKFSDGPGKIEVKITSAFFCGEVLAPLAPTLAPDYSNFGEVLTFKSRYGCGLDVG